MTSPSLRILVALLAVFSLLAAPACSSKPKKRKKTVLMTTWDEKDVGREAAADVEKQMGLMGDPALDEYVTDIGLKLIRGLPNRRFQYRFWVVDMPEPNAFALPGGYIFVSRGLLTLVETEDELACVIGHEIIHAHKRHGAAQQELGKRGVPLPWARAKRMASYGRDMERESDKYGQILCATAGYDPMGMSTFLARLGQVERLNLGYARGQSFFDSHPGSTERAASNAARAGELRWVPDPALGTREQKLARLREHTERLPIGQRPEAGIFRGREFIHPDLDFRLLFPGGWLTQNSASAVGAMAPRRDAVVYLAAGGKPGEPKEVAHAFVEKGREDGESFRVTESKPVKVGEIDSWRMQLEGAGAVSLITFFPYRGGMWRMTGMSRAVAASKYLPATLNTTRSFRPLTPEERDSVSETSLHWVKARAGDTVESIGERAGSAWDANTAAVFNGVFTTHRYQGGEWVKIARVQPYRPRKTASR